MAEEEKEKNNLVKDREIKEAKVMSERWYELFSYSMIRTNENSDQFLKDQTNLSTQTLLFSATIAGILGANQGVEISLVIKIFLAVGWLSLFVSMTLGIVNAHIKRSFWDKNADINRNCFQAFDSVVFGENSLEHAKELQKAYTGGEKKTTSKRWPWLLQSTLLGLGVLCVMIGIGFLIWQL